MALVLLFLLLVHVVPAFGVSVVAPSGAYHGFSYPQLQAKWWNFILGQPDGFDPRGDLTGELCGSGQSGDVWFLVGSVGQGGRVVHRTCAVPSGKSLFFPIINQARFSDMVLSGLKEKATQEQVSISQAAVVRAWVDGQEIRNVRQYLSQSVEFEMEIAEDNKFNLHPGAMMTPVVDEGYYLLLMPLAQGSHKIRIQAAHAEGEGGMIDVTYKLRVGGRTSFAST
eukprot:TRINITY_DN9672_c0_g1_i1.p1 TRINITY_DN9672_c0_g1~~TRINITY_DN9672_c0_g1_i1.p1  ORF type:complete len:225 (-),score=44.75 TRINITY_DN9672_c0_g1_i1:528-1202(-)